MYDYLFVPYVGARPLTFDMSPQQVEAMLGPAEAVEVNARGEKSEVRPAVTIRYSAERQEMVEIFFQSAARVFYRGTNLMEMSALDLIVLLSRYDTPFEYDGGVVFFALGLAVPGVPPQVNPRTSIVVYRAGRFKELREQLLGSHAPLEPDRSLEH